MAASEVDREMVPGTIYLVDVAGDMDHDGNRQVVLNPRPSADPEDPLNWSRPRKLLAISMVYVYVVAIGIATAVQYSVLTPISDETGISISDLNLGTGLMFLFLGWSCLIWQPIALAYGRRGVYITSCILAIGPMIWTAYSHSSHVWYAHRILLGICSAPVESLPEISVPDLFFAHERGTFMGYYAFLLFGSNFLAPFFAGFINNGVGWRWVMYFGALWLAGSAVILFFFMEDTIYFRQAEALGTVERAASELHTPDCVTETSDKKAADLDVGTCVLDTQVDPAFLAPLNYVQKLSLFRLLPGRPTPRKILKEFLNPLKIILFFPSVFWAGLLYGTNLSWYNVLNATTSSILSSAPYNFSSSMVGVAYLSPFVGAGLASLWSGLVADKLMLRLARRNNGVREPEQRLWPLLFSGLMASAGLILWGVGAAKNIHYMGLIVGLGILTFGVVCGGSISLSYSIDCFKEISGESMVSVIIIRNSLGFGFSYAINPWINRSGLQNCFIAVSMVALACTGSFLLMVLFGKKLRKLSAPIYWKMVENGSRAH
ncbi:hypothetical protein CNMCM5793_003530 [Aspergillus hiratsukae]|uniref:Major facilitator superfamily (MFS) profile domain-containing protein n=1 Tax=Aspergillus hiratsukae TaxID=1194566 RepID=A0A8H6PE47_9EURO|nr:hypothetical protein CNMCM5793_003530 [Aspergillus hiratsukae]KAF7172213.1 hypothetical protein CNMCM6106_006463 [Aspergillus hiratsukae]